jgi:hypothetical protein
VRIRYQAGHDLRKAILRGAIRRNAQIDFRGAPTPNSGALELAAQEGRILVSHDYQTMPALFRQFCESHSSPGVLLISQDLPVSRAIESLLSICEHTAPEDWQNRLCLIPSLVTIATGSV